MDTGNYMANQMDDQITAGIMLQDEIITDAIEIYKKTHLRTSTILEQRNEMLEMLKELLMDLDEIDYPTSMNDTVFRAEELTKKQPNDKPR